MKCKFKLLENVLKTDGMVIMVEFKIGRNCMNIVGAKLTFKFANDNHNYNEYSCTIDTDITCAVLRRHYKINFFLNSTITCSIVEQGRRGWG